MDNNNYRKDLNAAIRSSKKIKKIIEDNTRVFTVEGGDSHTGIPSNFLYMVSK